MANKLRGMLHRLRELLHATEELLDTRTRQRDLWQKAANGWMVNTKELKKERTQLRADLEEAKHNVTEYTTCLHNRNNSLQLEQREHADTLTLYKRACSALEIAHRSLNASESDVARLTKDVQEMKAVIIELKWSREIVNAISVNRKRELESVERGKLFTLFGWSCSIFKVGA